MARYRPRGSVIGKTNVDGAKVLVGSIALAFPHLEEHRHTRTEIFPGDPEQPRPVEEVLLSVRPDNEAKSLLGNNTVDSALHITPPGGAA